LEDQKSIVANNIGDFFRYQREYLANVRETVNQRNLVANEYFRSKIALNEKKNKKLLMDHRFWDLDSECAKDLAIDVETIKQDPDVAKKLFYADVL